MTETIKNTAEKIRKLEVQGARNVAIAAIKAIQTLGEQSEAKNKKEFSGTQENPNRAFCIQRN